MNNLRKALFSMKFIVVYHFLFFFDIYIFKTKVVKTARLWKSQYTTRWPLYKCCILRSILPKGFLLRKWKTPRKVFQWKVLACSFHLHLPDKSRCGYWKRYILQEHDCVQMYLPAYKQLPSDEKRKRIWDILFAWYLARNKKRRKSYPFFGSF